ncbi:type VII secretion system-associated protein [Streptomyces sp. NPDC090106]|uniref:type VII secretion system-associated protein n=1 Tax=Streptomyces sp. NPDC090106 TaxID=3365946 RepID=UPI0038035DAB
MSDVSVPKPSVGEVPSRIAQAARAAPDHWFGMVDPAWRGEDAPPDWAVVGRYRSDADGEVVEWQPNDDYRPSPSANGWPDPTDPVDDAIQRAATGYGPEEDVFRLLAGAEVSVLLAPDGRPVEARGPDGAPVVPVFTSVPQLRAGGRYASAEVLVRDLVRELAEGTQLFVNPAGAVSMTVAPAQLVVPPAEQAMAETEPDSEPETEPESDVRPAENEAESEAESEAEDEVAVEATPELSRQDYLVSILSGGGGR